jgi:hypothetical protein
MSDLLMEDVEALQSFPSEARAIKSGQYTVSTQEEIELVASDNQIHTEIWFKTPVCSAHPNPTISALLIILCTLQPLSLDTIQRITQLQLYAESHDQGFADEPSGGNWTWFELAILEDGKATAPRMKDGIELVWKSHRNRFLTDDYDWVCEPNIFV